MTEIMTWLVQCGIIAVILSSAAWAWESGARWWGRPARWAWLAALLGSVTLPFVLRSIPAQTWSGAMPPVGVMRLDALLIAPPSTEAAAFDPTRLALVLWLILSLLVACYATVLFVRLARARRGWREAELDGARVLVSRNLGPAAVGVRRGVVVIPSWALQLDVELRRLMLLHEREHVSAGDPRALLGALLLLAVMPWNPLVWLQLLRLRNAIELDCDARVLRGGVDPKQYGSLLLEIGRRRSSSPLVFATFAEPRMFLEQRIRRIARWPVPRRPLRAAALSVVALALFSTALVARVHVESVGSALAGDGRVLDVLGLSSAPQSSVPPMATDTPPPIPALRPNPRATPYTQAPSLKNSDALIRQMTELYPARLRAAEIGGTATLWLLVTESGDVRQVQLSRTSGHAALDSVALIIAQQMAFTPARLEQRPVPAWIEVPLAFGQIAHSIVINEQPVQVQTSSALSDKPTFTPMTQRPELQNAGEVQRALIQNYPPLLRDAGIGGTAVLWFFIDENGSVVKTQLHTSSGYPALDEAATRVAQGMRFSPAKNRDKVVNVWIEIPILFTAKNPAPSNQARDLREVPVQWAEQRSAVTPAPVERTQRDVAIPPAPGAYPELTNADAVRAAVASSYPPLLRDAGITGTALVSINILSNGMPISSRLVTSSGYPALDEAAAKVVSKMRFSPAANHPVTIEMPITFGETAARVAAPQIAEPPAAKQPMEFTPVTQRPELVNSAQIQRDLIRNYPPLLRDAGIGGAVSIWFFIDEHGQVAKTTLKQSSGYPALDEAALNVAAMMRFKPAMNRDKPVAGWFDIPVLFTAK